MASSTPRRPGRVAFGLAMGLGFGLGALPVFLGVLNHDAAWYLHAAGRVLAGDRLYADLIETNPPLIVWMSMGPRIVGRWSGISEILAARLLVLGLVGASIGATGMTLLRALPDRPGIRRGVLLLALVVLLPLPGYDFGQREHLMVILALPYLVMASGRAAGGRPMGGLAWLVGGMAGVGLALKPHFLLPWVAVEGYLCARRGRRMAIRPEAVAAAIVVLAVGVAGGVLAPEYFRLIRWAGPVYAASGRASWGTLMGQPGTALAILSGLGFLALRAGRDDRDDLGVFAVAGLGFWGIAILQGKGYPYHFYPPMALSMLLIGRLAVGPLLDAPGEARRLAVAMMRGALIAVLAIVGASRVRDSRTWGGRPGASDTPTGRLIRAAEAHAGGGGRVFAFSTAVAAGFPMVNYAGVGWASRHPALWFLPAFYPEGLEAGPDVAPRTPAAMGDAERSLFESVVEPLLADRPAALFVDETGSPGAFRGRRFDYLGYYAADPRFADFLEGYESIDRVDQFRVYRRKGR